MEQRLTNILYDILLISGFMAQSLATAIEFEIHDKVKLPQSQFAIEQISLAVQGYDSGDNIPPSKITIRLEIDEFPGEQAYKIEPGQNEICVYGGGPAGILYGGLELAEHIRLNRQLPKSEIHGKPFMDRRGIKMNIPLDARTPSYDDTGDAAIKNTINVWDINFWHEYLDSMAINRYNTLTLWNPHPFPSMIYQESYPEVALDDICITTLIPKGIENEWGEPQLVSTNVIANLKVIKVMSIDEKIAFWKEVMRYASHRCIDIYFITWNICPNSVANPVEPFYRTYGVPIWEEPSGKYGVTHQINDPDTIAYMRDAVKTFLLTYPDLKGIGITAGEHMPHKQTEYPVEEFLWNTYGLGILDAKEIQPNREIPFIHRFWNTNIEDIMKYWNEYPDPFSFSMKYAKARLYSTSKPPFAQNNIKRMIAHNLKSWWNLRNDDIFVHRWGDPDYVREFLTNFDQKSTIGYHMGSDGYVWGRDFISRDPDINGTLEFDKHWYKFMLWGRLGYNPGLGKEFWIQQLAFRFHDTDVNLLYDSWKAASEIIPEVNRFHWRDWDHMWSVEGCLSQIGGFREVFDFITNPTLEGSGILNPWNYVSAIRQMQTELGTTPLDVAKNLERQSETAIKGVESLKYQNNSKSLNLTLSDIESMSWLGRYYAAKIRAAVEIAWFQQTGAFERKSNAVSEMEKALEAWKQYATICNTNYYSQHLARTKYLDWNFLTMEAERDLRLVREMEL